MGMYVIQTPVRTPMANAIGEGVIGAMRRECLELVIPLGENHLYGLLQAWVAHYNEGRPTCRYGQVFPSRPQDGRCRSRRSDTSCQRNALLWYVQSSAAYITNTSWLNRQREDADKCRGATDSARVSLEVCKMVPERFVIPEIVENGAVVLQNDTPLLDGAHVDIFISPTDVTPALEAELDQWDKASDEAWAMIDQWEVEEQ